MTETKPFCISKQAVWEAWQRVRANQGACGVDGQSIADFEKNLKGNGHVIAWGDDSEHFSPASFGLLQQLWHAPGHTLSKEDIRQDVIEDYEATDNAIWLRINSARQELRNVEFPYEIETLRGKGYRLTARQAPVQFIKG